MTKLKLLLLTLLSVLSFNLFSQTQVYVTQTSGPNICDGTAVLDTSNVLPTSIYWQGMGMIINQGSYMVTNLCPGTYSVTFNSNGTPVTLTFTIISIIVSIFTSTFMNIISSGEWFFIYSIFFCFIPIAVTAEVAEKLKQSGY